MREEFFLTRLRWLKSIGNSEFQEVYGLSKAQTSRSIRKLADHFSYLLQSFGPFTRRYTLLDEKISAESIIARLPKANTGKKILDLISAQAAADEISEGDSRWFPEIRMDSLDLRLPVKIHDNVVEVILQSIINKKNITFNYTSREKVENRIVSADRLACLFGKYYLHAYDQITEEWRVFKIARMSEAEEIHTEKTYMSSKRTQTQSSVQLKFGLNPQLPDKVKRRLANEWDLDNNSTLTIDTIKCWAGTIIHHMIEIKSMDSSGAEVQPYWVKL